jgi:membrane protein
VRAELFRAAHSLVRRTRIRAANADVLLGAAALTFYAALGVVPLLLIALRLASALTSAASVRGTAEALSAYLPGPLRVDAAIRWFADHASLASWGAVTAAVIPASLYSEGMVRTLEQISIAPERHSRALRGRLLTLGLGAVATLGALIVVVALRPIIAASYGRGTSARLLGIFIAFCIAWAGATAFLTLLYRVFATTAVRTSALWWGAASTGSWLAGQSLGFVVVLRVAGGVGGAFGGSEVAGAIATIAFLTYLNHVAFLLGYCLTLTLHETPARTWSNAVREEASPVRPLVPTRRRQR